VNPDGPAAVQVTLTGGPCDGQIINVWPRGGGVMPYTVEALPPAPPRDIDEPPAPGQYHTYIRVGDARQARRYLYAPDVGRA
jgi:hypothetical protein